MPFVSTRHWNAFERRTTASGVLRPRPLDSFRQTFDTRDEFQATKLYAGELARRHHNLNPESRRNIFLLLRGRLNVSVLSRINEAAFEIACRVVRYFLSPWLGVYVMTRDEFWGELAENVSADLRTPEVCSCCGRKVSLLSDSPATMVCSRRFSGLAWTFLTLYRTRCMLPRVYLESFSVKVKSKIRFADAQPVE